MKRGKVFVARAWPESTSSALGYNEHAEKLSFLSIYLGQGRRFNQRMYDAADNDDENDM